MTNTNDIDFSDIQGLVRFAHGHLSEALFLLLTVNDVEIARDWLRSAPVTTATTVTQLPDHALQVAFTSHGLRALEVDESVIDEFSEEFIAGMVGDDNRSRRLGDVDNNSPGNWEWGGTASEIPHLVLMLYARPGGLQDWQEEIQSEKFSTAFQLLSTLTTTNNGSKEPFGFVDGISQPKIDWQRTVSTDLHARDRYANLLALGEVVLGYPNEYGLYTERPLLDPLQSSDAQQLPIAEDQPKLRDLGCNGSYLVLRQLSQDVAGFWQFLDGEANSNAEERERLATVMIGRQRDGTPLVKMASEAILGSDGEKPRTLANKFNFDDDPQGLRCPIGAHIRRANPRTGDFPVGVTGIITRLIRILGFGRRYPKEDLVASSRFHRLLRRGRPYGSMLSPEDAVKHDAPEDERGLQFVCLGVDISRQFDFVQNAWMISSKFSGLPTESDPLLGNREPLLSGEATDRFTIPQENGPARCIANLPQFVTVRGGAYFFMPGIKALQYITRQPKVSTFKEKTNQV